MGNNFCTSIKWNIQSTNLIWLHEWCWKKPWTTFKLNTVLSLKYKMSSTSLFICCCTSSSAFCLTWHLTNMMLRSAVCIIRCRNKNGKYMTKNLCLIQQVEYLCWFGYLNRLGKHKSVHSITFQSDWKDYLYPSPSEIYLFQAPLPLEIFKTLHGLASHADILRPVMRSSPQTSAQ